MWTTVERSEMRGEAPSDAPVSAALGPEGRVMVLFETGDAGAAAIELARDLTERHDSALTVVSVVPQAPGGPRCGNSAREYNTIVMEQVPPSWGRRGR